MIIDSHQHFWQRDLPFDYDWLEAPENHRINRDFLPDDLASHLEKTGVTHSVFVQTQHNLEENRWALQLAQENAFLCGVVGWVDLASESCESQLQEFKDHDLFVGIRHITQDEPDDDFIVRPEILRGLKILEQHQVPFDLLFYAKHLHHAPAVARHVPDLPLVIDHLSKPKIRDADHERWSQELKAASAFPNVYCKLSGMITEASWDSWTVDDLKPFVETALECFGAERLMYGSDWPVCELAGSYEQVHHALDSLLKELSDSERNSIFCETAREFYNLQI